MLPDRIRLGSLAVVALFIFPYSAFAQTTTSTDSAIAELRQLLADQRSLLDRQTQIIEEQGRRLAALERRDVDLPATATAVSAVEAQAPLHREKTEGETQI